MKRLIVFIFFMASIISLNAQWEEFEKFKSMKLFNESCSIAKFSDDGKFIYAVGSDKDEFGKYVRKLKIIDIINGNIVEEITPENLGDTNRYPRILDVTSDGKYLVIYNKQQVDGFDAGCFSVYDLNNQKLYYEYKLLDSTSDSYNAKWYEIMYYDCLISPDNRKMFIGIRIRKTIGSPESIYYDFGKVIELSTGEPLYSIKSGGGRFFYFSKNSRFGSGFWTEVEKRWDTNTSYTTPGYSFKEENGKNCMFYDLNGNVCSPVLFRHFSNKNNLYGFNDVNFNALEDTISYWKMTEYEDKIEFHQKKILDLYLGNLPSALSVNDKYLVYFKFGDLYHFNQENNLLVSRIDLGKDFPIYDYFHLELSPIDNKIMIYDRDGRIAITESPYLSDELNSLIYPQNATEYIDSAEVQFIDFSTGDIKSRLWDFGDGTTSIEEKPVHKYTKPGFYTISLVVSDGESTDTNFTYVLIHEKIKARFSPDKTKGFAPLTVNFTDESILNPIKWDWDFGDGNTSEEQNPLHTYNDTGRYEVTLIVKNTTISDTLKSGYYIDAISEFKADFAVDSSEGNAPFGVGFKDMSSGYPYKWEWDFGDGNTSNDTNPKYTFDYPGVYTVKLKTSGGGFEDEVIKKDIIVAGERDDKVFRDSWMAHKGSITDIKYSRDGEKIYSSGTDSLIKVWDAATYDLIDTIRCPAVPVSIDINPAMDRLAVVCDKGINSEILIVDLSNNKILKIYEPVNNINLDGLIDPVFTYRDISFNNEIDSLYTFLVYRYKISKNGYYHDYWKSLTIVYDLNENIPPIKYNDFYIYKKTHDLNTILTCYNIKDIGRLNGKTDFYSAYEYGINSVYDLKNNVITKFKTYSLGNFKRDVYWDKFNKGVNKSKVYFSFDSKRMFFWSVNADGLYDYSTGIYQNGWNIQNNNPVGYSDFHNVIDAAFNFNGNYLLIGTSNRSFRIYTFDERLLNSEGVVYPFDSFSFESASSPKDNIIATGSKDGYIRLWDLDNVVGVDENYTDTEKTISAWPNPFSDVVMINCNLPGSILTISDSYGREVYRNKITSGTTSWQPSGLPSGVYFIKIQSGDKIYIKKLVYVMGN